jgi:hypothetical protein
MRDDAITFRRRCGAFESNTETGGRFYSDTFSCEKERPWEAVAIADMFLHETFSPQCLTSKRILEQYFRVGAVNPCTMNCRVNVEDDGGYVVSTTEWKRVPAVQFYRVVEDPTTIVKKQLLRDSQSMDARRHGRNAVSISVVFKMDTDEDKINFCRSLMGNRLIDFMRPDAYVHSSTVTRLIERTVVQDDEPDSSQDEDVASDAEPTSPNYAPTSPGYRPMGTPSPLRSPVLSANPVAGTGDRAKALQHISNALFDLKETMPDNSYRQLSASLKRSYDEMLNANNNNNYGTINDPDLVDYEAPDEQYVATP